MTNTKEYNEAVEKLAKYLRANYKDGNTWEDTAKQAIEALGIEIVSNKSISDVYVKGANGQYIKVEVEQSNPKVYVENIKGAE